MAANPADEELALELQELYLTGKQWLSDIAFMEEELGFLKELMGRFSLPLPGDPSETKRYEIISALPLREAFHLELKQEVTVFMGKLEPMILGPGRQISLQLIEDYSLLKQKVTDALLKLKAIKYACINFYRKNG